MKKIFILLVLNVLICEPLYGDENTHRDLAEELLVLTKVEESREKNIEAFKQMFVSQLQTKNSPENGGENLLSIMTEIWDNDMSWDKIKEGFIDIYVEAFNEEELRQINEFYKSPSGQALLIKMPEITQKSIEFSTALVQPKLNKMLEEYGKRVMESTHKEQKQAE